MVPTRDNREERRFLLETKEKRDGSYQRQERTSYQGQDSRKMVPTRDNREQRGLLPETREKRACSYQRQEKIESVPTRGMREERWFLPETRERVQTRDKRSSSQAKKM